MTGLILKDLMNLKKQGKIYLIVVVFYMFFSYQSEDASFLNTMIFLFSAMIPITALSYDERADWDKYALSMSVTRKEIVISKYILGLLCMGVGVILAMLFNIATASKVEVNYSVLYNSFFLGILFLAIVLPILLKYGVEKGRMLMLIVIFLPTAFGIMVMNFNLSLPSPDTIEKLKSAYPVAVVIILIISIFVSLQIYERKEF